MRKKFTCNKNTSLEDLLELLRGLEVQQLPLNSNVELDRFEICICFSSRGRERGLWKTRGRFSTWWQTPRTS